MINPDHLKALRFLTGDSALRPQLKGVRVEVKGERVVTQATNGNLAGMCKGTTASDDLPAESFTIPNDAADLILKAAKNMPITVKPGQDGHLIAAGVFFKPMDLAYPDVRRIIPESPSGETAQFSTDLLARFSKSAKALGAKTGNFHLTHNGRGAALVRIPGRLDFIGVAMPYDFKDPALAPVAGFKH